MPACAVLLICHVFPVCVWDLPQVSVPWLVAAGRGKPRSAEQSGSDLPSYKGDETFGVLHEYTCWTGFSALCLNLTRCWGLFLTHIILSVWARRDFTRFPLVMFKIPGIWACTCFNRFFPCFFYYYYYWLNLVVWKSRPFLDPNGKNIHFTCDYISSIWLFVVEK